MYTSAIHAVSAVFIFVNIREASQVGPKIAYNIAWLFYNVR
jgi:hypothetical protein